MLFFKKVLLLKDKIGQLTAISIIIFSFILINYLAIFKPQLSSSLVSITIIFSFLIFFWFSCLIVARFKNIKYKNNYNKASLFINRILWFFYMTLAVLSLALYIDNGYNFSLICILLSNIFTLIFFLFNKMHRPLGQNIDIIRQRQAATLKLNNLKLIVALPKLKVIKNGKILIDVVLQVLSPVNHWNDEYKQQNIIIHHLHNFVLKDVFKHSFYNKYILKVIFLSEQAVLFKLTEK